MAGLRPIVEVMTINFILLAMDQVVNNAAKLRYMSNGQITVPLVIRTVTGGGAQLAATHSQSLEGWFASVPGLKVAVPSNPYDALGLLRTSIADEDPVIFAEHALLYNTRGESLTSSTKCRSERLPSSARAPTSPWSPTGEWFMSRRTPL